MTDLVKTASVLDLTLVLHTRSVTFAQVMTGTPEDNAPGSVKSIEMSHEAWQDMGEPRQVTVVVQPGDKLNEVSDMAYFIRSTEPETDKLKDV